MEYPEFPDHSRFTPVASVLAGAGEGEVTVRGWVYRTRSSGLAPDRSHSPRHRETHSLKSFCP